MERWIPSKFDYFPGPGTVRLFVTQLGDQTVFRRIVYILSCRFIDLLVKSAACLLSEVVHLETFPVK